MKKILILGGTGFVGRSLCGRLAEEEGDSLTVPSRHPAAAKHLQVLPAVRVVRADVHDPAQLEALCQGQDAVVNLVAILHGNEASFRRAHVALPRTLIDACQSAGVKRVVHVSALGVDSTQPSLYLRSKAEGEALLKASGLALTVLRPSVIYGAHDRFLNLFAKLARIAPVFPLAGADARFQPVWVEDVAQAIATCLAQPETIGKTFECAGPDVFSLAELVRLAGRWSGHERPVFGLPNVIASVQAGLMELLPGEPMMSRDNLASMRTPNVASGRLPGLVALGIEPAALASIAPAYLASDRGIGRLDGLRGSRR